MSTLRTLPVLVAVDGSDGSLRALDVALAEAKLRRVPLRLVHVRQHPVWPSPDAPAAPGALVRERPVSSEDRVLTSVLDALAGRAGLPDLETYSTAGMPGVVLPELGAGAQLMVLGSRGRGGFASLLLGSNGMAAARDAPCPVVVVPRAGHEVPGEEPVAPGARVVVGVPAEAPDAATLDFACTAAARRRARLDIVCAYPRPRYDWSAADEDTATLRGQAATGDHVTAEAATAGRLDEILAPYRQAYPHVAMVPRVAPGDAAGHIVAVSKGAELVVVGRHHRRLPRTARIIGSVTHAVLLHAAAPVAVVPPNDAWSSESAATRRS